MWAGASYVFGRILCYTALGACISASLVNAPLLSYYLQMYMPKAIGPLLVLTGVVLLDLIVLPFSGFVISQTRVQSLKSRGAWGALLLGIIFALAFCPVSAALFFGSLIPLAVSNTSPLLFPFVYGLGTGLPVIAFAAALVFGVQRVASLFKKVTAAERFVRIATGVILILIGLYYTSKYIFYFDLF